MYLSFCTVLAEESHCVLWMLGSIVRHYDSWVINHRVTFKHLINRHIFQQLLEASQTECTLGMRSESLSLRTTVHIVRKCITTGGQEESHLCHSSWWGICCLSVINNTMLLLWSETQTFIAIYRVRGGRNTILDTKDSQRREWTESAIYLFHNPGFLPL